MSPAVEWTLFLLLATGAIAGAYRMLRTMSMVRAGIFLMGSFCSIAGLFLLLSADLIAAMQIMMYVGGMLVMIVFMVMMSPDPGGSMMGIAPPEEEMDMQRGSKQHHDMQGDRMNQSHESADEKQYTCPMHPDVRSDSPGKCPRCGMKLQPTSGAEHGVMEMQGMDMAMTHEFTRPAAIIGFIAGAVLLAAVLSFDWPSAPGLANFDSGLIVGKELLSRYMIAFEAAAILIITGMVGAVILGRRE